MKATVEGNNYYLLNPANTSSVILPAASNSATRKLPAPAAWSSACSAQAFQNRAACTAAVKASLGCTAANAPHKTESIHPAPVTVRIRSLPPRTVQSCCPSAIRSSVPESSTTHPKAPAGLAAALAQKLVCGAAFRHRGPDCRWAAALHRARRQRPDAHRDGGRVYAFRFAWK